MIDLHFAAPRHEMVQEIAMHVRMTSDQIGRETLAERVIAAMEKVPRHEFVPIELRGFAYVNSPLPIGHGKTISQPYMNALMADLLDAGPDDIVLEIGTGFGYQAAVLAELVAKVYTVEIIDELVEEARRRLTAPDLVPPALIQQLKPGGRMVIPAGIEDAQQLMIVDKSADGRIDIREVLPVRFSPLISDDEL